MTPGFGSRTGDIVLPFSLPSFLLPLECAGSCLASLGIEFARIERNIQMHLMITEHRRRRTDGRADEGSSGFIGRPPNFIARSRQNVAPQPLEVFCPVGARAKFHCASKFDQQATTTNINDKPSQSRPTIKPAPQLMQGCAINRPTFLLPRSSRRADCCPWLCEYDWQLTRHNTTTALDRSQVTTAAAATKDALHCQTRCESDLAASDSVGDNLLNISPRHCCWRRRPPAGHSNCSVLDVNGATR